MLRRFLPYFLAAVTFALFWQHAVFAADIPYSVRQAVVWVHCGNRQGSGVVVNGERGYVLTNAHVLLNLDTKQPGRCEVGFINEQSFEPSVFYAAEAEKFVFDEALNRDFAILKIGQPEQTRRLPSFPSLKTDEFASLNDPLTILSYPNTADGLQDVSRGKIIGFEQGMVKTDAAFTSGSSGGPGINDKNSLIGLATGILYEETSPGVEKVIDYELVDIRAILNWLDTFGAGVHDAYVTHYDPGRYHGPATYVTTAALNCTLLAKSELDATVYCLKTDGTRSVFPNAATYASWFADFSPVVAVPSQQLATYRLNNVLVMKPGSLVKIESDPRVYIVTDGTGTLRWIPNESRARELFGQGWAGFVKDVPVTFFQNYKIGEPLPL